LSGASTFVGTLDGLASWSVEFSRVLTASVQLANFDVMSWDEKLSFSSVILADRIVTFAAKSLMTPKFPTSLNSIWFLLELWIEVKGNPPAAIALRALGQKFLRNSTKWNRAQLIRYLTDDSITGWFPPFWSASLLRTLDDIPALGDMQIPKTWESDESPGNGVFLFLEKFKLKL